MGGAERALTEVSIVGAGHELPGRRARLRLEGQRVGHCLAGQHSHLRRGLHHLLPCITQASTAEGDSVQWCTAFMAMTQPSAKAPAAVCPVSDA